MTITTKPTADEIRAVRAAEHTCRVRAAELDDMADALVRYAPPASVDLAGSRHNLRLASIRREEASLQRECATACAEYAAELEARA